MLRPTANAANAAHILRSNSGRALIAAVVVLLAAVYVSAAVDFYRAATEADRADPASLEEAVRRRPANAEYQNRLGRVLLFTGIDVDAAISRFQTAAALNPYSGRNWLDLATAESVAGRPQEQMKAIRRALEAAPHDSPIAWEAAVIMVAGGQTDEALRQLRVVFAGAPEMTDQALDMGWRATHDARAMIELAFPPHPELYGKALNLAVHQGNRAAADSFWEGLLQLGQPIDPRLTFDYLDFLIGQRDADAAWSGWQQMLKLNHMPASSRPENLVTNPGFEEDSLNGGFDWRSVQQWQDTIAIDTSVFHSGTRSASIVFNGPPVNDLGLYQHVRVKPHTSYEISAFVKSDELRGSGGPLLRIEDTFSHAPLFSTDDLIGSSPWHHWSGGFATGDSSLITVRLVRDPGNSNIRGSFWIDDVRLKESSEK
jgi:tetratricopeptide (TPR) repeat protein